MKLLDSVLCLGKGKNFTDVEEEKKNVSVECEGHGVNEDGRSTGCSPDSSLVAASSLSNSNTTSLSGGKRSTYKKTNKGATLLIIFGVLGVLFGFLSIVWTPLSILMNERLKMTPGLPPYDWWQTPPDEVYLRVYVFNITNGEEFLSGAHDKLRFQEIGPFVFLEKLEHLNVTFNNNGTLSYVARRTAVFRPELTAVDLNETIIVPNMAMLAVGSYLYNANFLTKFGYNMLLRRMNSKPFVPISVDNYFWNYSDPLLNLAKKLVPFFVPLDNMGILHRIYSDFTDKATVYMGTSNARRFFTMENYHDSPRFGYWENETCDAVNGATEGITYPQAITRNDTLNYWRKTICRIMPVKYVADVLNDGMDALRFELPEDLFDRTEDRETDCYSGSEPVPLQSGLSDVAPCYYGFPMAASLPHFFNGDSSLIDSIEGIKPERSKHGSFVIVEPVTGIPMESCARIQCNLVMREVSGMSRLGRFNNLVLPMFWAEYHQVGLPSRIYNLMYFIVQILPDLQACLSFLGVAIGGAMLFAGLFRVTCKDRRKKRKKFNAYSSLDLIPSTSSSDS